MQKFLNKFAKEEKMAHPIFWVGLVAIKIFGAFSLGKKYHVSSMEDALRDEMRAQNVPEEYIGTILQNIRKKISDQNEHVTPDYFIDLFLEVIDENVALATEWLDKTIESANQKIAKTLRHIADVFDKK
ncbi:MAG: hypothetical protein CR972_03665 [Candidatus Moraniibacteriota bacterium]|nr:MAG: hypothetical protein CR972_03665 [Candidatus Moranbacteria bacterium]